MVETQIRGRGILDARVLDAMAAVPRHRFIRPQDVDLAYGDYPVDIGLGQTISQPYIVAFMSEALDLTPTDRVLEIGTGSGYQTAVLAELAAEVYPIEVVPVACRGSRRPAARSGIHQHSTAQRRRVFRLARRGAVRRGHRDRRAGSSAAAARRSVESRRPHGRPDRAGRSGAADVAQGRRRPASIEPLAGAVRAAYAAPVRFRGSEVPRVPRCCSSNSGTRNFGISELRNLGTSLNFGTSEPRNFGTASQQVG